MNTSALGYSYHFVFVFQFILQFPSSWQHFHFSVMIFLIIVFHARFLLIILSLWLNMFSFNLQVLIYKLDLVFSIKFKLCSYAKKKKRKKKKRTLLCCPQVEFLHIWVGRSENILFDFFEKAPRSTKFGCIFCFFSQKSEKTCNFTKIWCILDLISLFFFKFYFWRWVGCWGQHNIFFLGLIP